MYQHHATATRSRRDLASNLGKTAFVLSKTTSVRVGSGLFEQTGTLKGVGLRATPFRVFLGLGETGLKSRNSIISALTMRLRRLIGVPASRHRYVLSTRSCIYSKP